MSSLRSGAWRWDVVDAASPAPPGVMGVDGEFLVVSVVDADGQDLSAVLGALGAGDVLNVGAGGGGGDLGPLTARVDAVETGLDTAKVHLQAFSEAMVADRKDHLAWRKTATDMIDAVEQAVADVAGDLAGLPLDGLADVTAPADTPAGKVLGTTAEGEWAPVDPPSGGATPQALDDLTDVDVSLSATGMMLTKQIDGTWKGANFTRPLNWLTDVVAPADAQGVLGTTAPGQWEPLPMDHLQQQIVGPLPGQVAALDQRIAALEVTPEPAPVDFALTVDNYSGGFTRLIGAEVIGTDPVRITVALATTPGVNGTVFADLSAISGSANVWADFAGTLGRVEDALTGTPVHGAVLKEVIRRGTVVVCHRDNTDPAHPTLQVTGTEAAGQAGTSLTLASLADVDNAAATAPAGKVLGTTAVGSWGPVDAPATDLGPLTTRVATVEQTVARLDSEDDREYTRQFAGDEMYVNGAGFLGRYNWPDIALDEFAHVFAGKQAYRVEQANATVLSSEPVFVDVSKQYEIAVHAKSLVPDQAGTVYVAVNAFDIDGQSIGPQHSSDATLGGTRTTLAAPLAVGDTTVTLADGTGWDESAVNRALALFPYTSATGALYEPYTYTRHIFPSMFTVAGDVLTLPEPWAWPNPNDPSGVWPVGTPIQNRMGSGSTFIYPAIVDLQHTSQWQEVRGVLGAPGSGAFRDGTAYVVPGFLANYNSTGGITVLSAATMRRLKRVSRDMADVDVSTGLDAGDVLGWDGSKWVPVPPTGGGGTPSLALNDLSDVEVEPGGHPGSVLRRDADGYWREGEPSASLDDIAALEREVNRRWMRWTGTAAEYAALPTKDPATLYVVLP